MAAARPTTSTPRTFDEAKFVAMTEPLSIRIEKIKSASRSPIPLPQVELEGGELAPPGEAWTKDAVRSLETWLVSQWAGGGSYEITVTDSSQPAPLAMKWAIYYPIADYPERTPPPLAGAAKNSPNPPAASPATPQPRAPIPMSSFPNGLPPGTPFPVMQPGQPVYYVQPPAPSLPAPPAYGSPAWHTYREEADRRERESELKELRERDKIRERETMERQHQAQLVAERAANEARATRQEQQITELRNMIASLAAKPTTPAVDPTVEALREQNRQLAAQAAAAAQLAETERREREAERRDQATREMIRAQAEASQRQYDQMARQFELLQAKLVEAAANKSDPVITLMQEQARQHAEALKEVARTNAETINRMHQSVMTPRDMIDLAARSQQQTDQATERVSRSFDSIMSMQQKVMENALQMQPGGSGVVDVVRDGVNGLKDMAERYMGARSTEARVNANAQVQMATAQAHIAEVQARAANPSAFMPPRAAEPIITPPPPMQNQLSGAQILEEPAAAPIVVPPPAPASPERLWGRTDEQWFGPAIDEVREMRERVARFHESLGMEPIRLRAAKPGEEPLPDGMTPEEAAAGILQAATFLQQKQIPVAAMIELLAQGQFKEFLAVLLPDAAQAYRDDVVEIIADYAKHMSGEDDDEGGDEGDDGDPDEDGGDDGDESANHVAPPAPRAVRPSILRPVS